MTNILILDESLVDLSEDEQKAVRGGAASCTYASKTYSQGSAVKQDDGKIYGSSLPFMLNQQTRCQDNILLTQKFRKFLKP